MLKYFSKSILFSSALALAACGGTGSTGGGPVAITPTFSDSTAENIGSKSSNEGLTGLMARSDLFSSSAGTVSAEIVLSADFSQATVYLNGANAGTLDEQFLGGGNSGGGLFTSGVQTLTGGSIPTAYYGIFYYTDGTNIGHAIVGTQTREANLPAASANYIGVWQAAIGLAGGDVGIADFNIDFTAGTFTGTLDGGVEVNAALTGLVVGGGLTGNATWTGAYTGGTSFNGLFFGPTANDLAGVLSGTLTTTAGGAPASLIGNVRTTYIP